MAHDVVLIPGDGIGPEITSAMRRVVEATGVQINWNVQNAGAGVMDEYGTPLPEHVLEAVRSTKVAIKGPITTPVGTGFRSVNVALRKEFDLYACVRPCLSQPGDGSRYRDVDLVIVRENTEDLYAGIEFDEGAPEVAKHAERVEATGQKPFASDSAISIKPISIERSRRIVEYAFEYARRCGRKKVTCVHKANIMKATDGLYLRVAREVAERYPDIEFNDKIVGATCMGLVQEPRDFGANIGTDAAIFEPTHGSAPDIAGKDIANPTAEILSAAMMLDHLGEVDAAERIRAAVRATLAEGTCVTGDVQRALTGSAEGAAGTQDYADAVIAHLS